MIADLLLTLVVLVIPGAQAAAADWRPIDQPDLARQLAQAPTLEPETLAAPARGVTSWTFQRQQPLPCGRRAGQASERDRREVETPAQQVG
jgi:hypothetical protein